MRKDFLGVPIDALTMGETVGRIDAAIRSRNPLHHVAMNVAKFVEIQRNMELRDDVLCADIVGVDGMGIVFGARSLGVQVPERVTGIDLMTETLALCEREGYRPFIVGARQQVLEAAVANLKQRFPALEFAGTHHGYFSVDEEATVVELIKSSKADCLFVAMPTPRKERFLARFRDDLSVPFVMGVGGSVDVIAGHVRRAPRWMQRTGMEWLFRFIMEPRRMWRRYLTTNAKFAVAMAVAHANRLSTAPELPAGGGALGVDRG